MEKRNPMVTIIDKLSCATGLLRADHSNGPTHDARLTNNAISAYSSNAPLPIKNQVVIQQAAASAVYNAASTNGFVVKFPFVSGLAIPALGFFRLGTGFGRFSHVAAFLCRKIRDFGDIK